MNIDDLFDFVNDDNGNNEGEGTDVDLLVEGLKETKRYETVFPVSEFDREAGKTVSVEAGVDELTGADFFCLFFSAEIDPRPCLDGRRDQFIRAAMESPDFQPLREDTEGNRAASVVAAVELSGVYRGGDKGDKDKDKEKKDTKPPVGKGGGLMRDEGDEGGDEASAALRAAMALRAAEDRVGELVESQYSIGGDGAVGTTMTPDQALRLFRKVRQSEKVRRIIDMAGAFRRVAQSKRRQKTRHGRDDMVGVTMGNDLGQAIPSELAKLVDPVFEWDQLRRFAERQLMLRDYQGEEPKGKGPVVIVVDESGSMAGRKEDQAKAFALAMAWLAAKEKRWCVLVGYSGGTGSITDHVILQPGKWDAGKVMDWLEHFWSGGTDRDVPVVELPEFWNEIKPPKGRTDVVMVTDAQARISHAVAERFNRWREEERVRVTTLGVGVRYGFGDLSKVSDETIAIAKMGAEVDQMAELFEKV